MGQVTFSGDSSVRLAEFDEPPAEPFGLLREWFEARRGGGAFPSRTR